MNRGKSSSRVRFLSKALYLPPTRSLPYFSVAFSGNPETQTHVGFPHELQPFESREGPLLHTIVLHRAQQTIGYSYVSDVETRLWYFQPEHVSSHHQHFFVVLSHRSPWYNERQARSGSCPAGYQSHRRCWPRSCPAGRFSCYPAANQSRRRCRAYPGRTLSSAAPASASPRCAPI